MDKSPRVLKIAGFCDGRLTIDGAPASLQSLHESLQKLAQERGVVWYYRESGEKEPPPIAADVIKEVIEARIPIRLSSKPDYSDTVGPGGSAGPK